MVCEYVEKCQKCRDGLKWFCTAAVPKKRVRDKQFCLDPVASECPLYERANGSG